MKKNGRSRNNGCYYTEHEIRVLRKHLNQRIQSAEEYLLLFKRDEHHFENAIRAKECLIGRYKQALDDLDNEIFGYHKNGELVGIMQPINSNFSREYYSPHKTERIRHVIKVRLKNLD